VATQVIGQVVAGDAHQVVGDHASVIGGVLLAADVGIDGGQALGHGARAIYGGLVDHLYLDVATSGLEPGANLVSSTAGCHAATDDENVDLFLDNLGFSEFGHSVTSLNFYLRPLRDA